jgi:hypothetical protein
MSQATVDRSSGSRAVANQFSWINAANLWPLKPELKTCDPDNPRDFLALFTTVGDRRFSERGRGRLTI